MYKATYRLCVGMYIKQIHLQSISLYTGKDSEIKKYENPKCKHLWSQASCTTATQSTEERTQGGGEQNSNSRERRTDRRRRCPQQPCSYAVTLRTQLLWYTSRAHEANAWQTVTGAGKASPDSAQPLSPFSVLAVSLFKGLQEGPTYLCVSSLFSWYKGGKICPGFSVAGYSHPNP